MPQDNPCAHQECASSKHCFSLFLLLWCVLVLTKNILADVCCIIQLLSWDCNAQYIRKKSKNVHAFFGDIAKNPKMCTAFSEKFSFTPGIFPKKLKTFSLFSNFSRKVAQRVYCQKSEIVQVFRNFFQKNFTPPTGVISKTTPRCVAAFWKNLKITALTLDYRKKYSKALHIVLTFSQKSFYILTCQITDLQWFVYHF